MSAEKPTLKDLAQALGVSAATVHRALHGKAGVGDETTREIKRLAAALGYQTNYMASALKRKQLRLAVVLPEPAGDSRYYCGALWAGARQLFREVPEFNPELVERAYPQTPGSHGAALEALLEQEGADLDGVVTVAVDHPRTAACMGRLAELGVPVALVGADLYRDCRLCCVKAYDQEAGALAAELLTAFHPPEFDGEIVLTGNPVGSFSMLDQYHNLCGFETYIQAHAPGVRLLSAYNSDAGLSCDQLRLLLQARPRLYAVYSASARHSVRVGELLQELGLAGRVRLVGNDLFPESRALLRQGVLTAVIHKKVDRQSYEATRLLFHYALKREVPPADALSICPEVVMVSNLTPEAGENAKQTETGVD